MEKKENGKIRVVGIKINSDGRIGEEADEPIFANESDRILHRFELAKYFERISFDQEGPAFLPNAIYIGSSEIRGVPGRTKLKTENFEITGNPRPGSVRWVRGRRRTPSKRVRLRANRIDDSVPREVTIKLAAGEGNLAFGMFYVNSKTLILGPLTHHPYGDIYIHQALSFLKRNNLIAPLNPGEVSNDFKKKVELHDGEKVEVRVPGPLTVVTVGCDPEFEFVVNGRAVSCDNSPVPFQGTGRNVKIGRDGAGAQVELRPDPSSDAGEVVANMKSLFNQIRDRNPSAHLSIKGDRFPCGGHIHAGVGMRYSPPRDLVFLLDHFIGKKVVDLSGEARNAYKSLSAVRDQPWGFEYRTPPSIIFQWPEFARLAMKAVKNLVECFVNGQVIVVNQEPVFEDYWNYCGFTPREYEKWLMFLEHADDFNNSKNPYRKNVISLWCGTIQQAAGRPRRQPGEKPEGLEGLLERILRDQQRRREQGGERAPEQPTRINLGDEWEEGTATMFRSRLQETFPEAQYPQIRIRMFGLAATRGPATFGYEAEGHERIPDNEHPPWMGSFGVPYDVRMNPVSDLTRQIKEAHLNAMIEEIRRRNPAPATEAAPATATEEDDSPDAAAEAHD